MIRRNDTNYWKSGFILLLGLVIGISIGRVTVFLKPIKENNKIELIISKDSTLTKDSTFKVKVKKSTIKDTKVSLLPLTEKNLKKELIRQGVSHPNIVLAQAKLESNLGKSEVAKRTNNLFGLRNGKRYRRFSHWTECVTAYKNLIQSKYEGGNYYAFLDKIGYAEDPSYTNKLRDMI
jgi:hypothetical protein